MTPPHPVPDRAFNAHAASLPASALDFGMTVNERVATLADVIREARLDLQRTTGAAYVSGDSPTDDAL